MAGHLFAGDLDLSRGLKPQADLVAADLDHHQRDAAGKLDAFVFLDDNPAERDQVRRELPQVAVPELPDDPALYPRVISAAGYFEAISFSEEDRRRADYYRANNERVEAVKAFGDMNSYLASLGMVISIRPFDAINRPRIVQLINKSNQFNLTTRRYT